MSYNQYGGNPYGMPPGYGGYGAPPPGRNAPPGLGTTTTLDANCEGVLTLDDIGPPPGMAAPPGMGAPPGMQQANAPQSGRPGGLPASFQAPANMPNINFNAPVIRLGTSTPTTEGGRGDRSQASGGRPGLGMERGSDQGRGAARESVQVLIPPTADEKLRTIMLHQIPDGIQGDEGVQKLLGAVGILRKWESSASVIDEHKGTKFGFAMFDDAESLSNAVKLLHEQDVEVPVQRQSGSTDAPPEDDNFEGIKKVTLQVAVDPTTLKYAETFEESRADNPAAFGKLEDAQAALKQVLRELFYPPISNGTDADGDTAMKNDADENVEVVNIPIAQEDELADIPAEMREVVAGEIAAFRERSNQRDLERLRKEEEMEEMERQRNAPSRPSGGANNIPLGPKGSVPNAPSGPRGQNGHNRVSFINGEFGLNRAEEDSDASDEELNQRQKKAQQAEDDKAYVDAERKWANRERSRQSALDREQDREKQEAETGQLKRDEHLGREKSWDDEREASRKSHPYYRDHATWARKRGMDRADEESKDDADRRAENDEHRREQAQMERARGMADSFLDQQAEEMDRREAAAAAAPQPFKLSLGAAAQKAQASRVPQRRTIAEVEGLLDDEDTEQSTKRQLIPIQMEPISGAAAMTEEEISQAVRALAQEIPSERDGLWSWEVKWDYMDDSVIREKLRPFVEKKVVDYLGVQEEMLVEAVEEHLRKHGTAAALVEELEGALDEDAEDLVKKLWRMVIFFTESEKRGLPA
ncbi:RNA recognition motif (RRM) superfamily protein [Metarhizium robertsii]|uniref:Splicing factor PWI n=2 Tax=Metarhizium robertsii TaxID=568076 RepID=E9F7G3_METRA|nr:Splicing factor PWI [Metarhizium robertsii ARSEF 23]EFY96300.1 Splicing factor PWI [Metarhizium robertsii ARSEF 23]EXU98577.1 RNA recognition motif (RRM) superfamily protein [Metarhizium robertsii]